MDQKSFEQGLLIGLNTAVAVLRDGGGLSQVEKHASEMREAIKERWHIGAATMREDDIFLKVPLAHPGDFGFEATPAQEHQVAASHLKPSLSVPVGRG